MAYAACKCIDQPVDVHIDESDHCHFYTLEKIGILMVLYFILFQNSVM